jgi:membrane protein DedA with SNARE-associated domain
MSLIALAPALLALGPWALALVMLAVFLETGLLVGFFLPGDALLFTVGVLAAAHALWAPWWLAVPLVGLAAFAGDQVGYLIGRRAGRRLWNRPRRWLPRRRILEAEEFFTRHGGRAVVLARFVPILRTLVPVVAGVARMDRRTFVRYNGVGAAAWVGAMLTAGYLLGGIPFVAAHVEVIVLALVAASLIPVVLEMVRRRRRGAVQQPDATRPTADPALVG